MTIREYLFDVSLDHDRLVFSDTVSKEGSPMRLLFTLILLLFTASFLTACSGDEEDEHSLDNEVTMPSMLQDSAEDDEDRDDEDEDDEDDEDDDEEDDD